MESQEGSDQTLVPSQEGNPSPAAEPPQLDLGLGALADGEGSSQNLGTLSPETPSVPSPSPTQLLLGFDALLAEEPSQGEAPGPLNGEASIELVESAVTAPSQAIPLAGIESGEEQKEIFKATVMDSVPENSSVAVPEIQVSEEATIELTQPVTAEENKSEMPNAASDASTTWEAMAAVETPPARKGAPQSDNAPLSLGFTELLSLEEGVVEHELDGPALAEEIAHDSAPSLSAYQVLEQNGDWQALSLLCEGRMQSEAEAVDALEVEARLWWVYAQIKMESVPLSILAAPLDTYTRADLATDSHSATMRAVASKALVAIATALHGNGDGEMALTFFERAFRFDPSTKGAFQSFVRDRLAALSIKLDRSALSPEEHQARSEQRKRFEKLANDLGTALPKEERNPSASSKLHASEVKKDQIEELLWPELRVDQARVKQLRFGLGLAAGALVILCIAVRQFLLTPPVEASSAQVALITDTILPHLHAPESSRSGGFTHLDALLYDIDRKPAAHGSPTQSMHQEPVNPATTLSGGTKQVVDTSGPLESEADFSRAVEREYSRSERSDPLWTGSSRRLPDRTYGQNLERFGSNGETYWVVTKTDVLDAPRYAGRVLGTLQAGDRVLVEGRIGDWLRLRARHGDVGYVLAQDTANHPLR